MQRRLLNRLKKCSATGGEHEVSNRGGKHKAQMNNQEKIYFAQSEAESEGKRMIRQGLKMM